MPRPPDPLTKYQREQAKHRQALADLQEDIATKHAAARDLQAKLAASEHQERLALQAQVGKLADDAGLLAYDLGTLGKLFAAVVRMSVTDPKAVGDFLGLDAILHGEVDVIQLVREEAPHAVHQ